MALENTVENLIDALFHALSYTYNLKDREYLEMAIRMASDDLAYQKLRQSEYDTEVHIATHYMK
jgi:hypothetical protein